MEYITIRKLIKIGTSHAITIPKDLVIMNSLTKGTKYEWTIIVRELEEKNEVQE